MTREHLEFSLLGPLEVVAGTGPVELGAPKHRALLALLLLEAGRVVSVDRLIDQLWHGEPPAAATSTLQAYVSNLRRILEPARAAGAAARILVTRPPGYVLDVRPEQVDVARFEQNVRLAIDARDGDRLEDAAVALADALALWRGQPLADVAYEPWAQNEIERLRELYLVALETQLLVDLDRGHHASAAVEAERLVKEYPVRERFRELQMLALYRAGRQAEALRAFQDARAVLVEELGIDPGPGLRALEDRILAQDPTLDWRSRRGAAPVIEPAEATDRMFVGRAPERSRLAVRLHETRRGSSRLVLVSGEPGIGKTRLCEELGASARSEGSVVVWARGWEGEGAPAFWPWVQVLRELAEHTEPEVMATAAASGAADLARVVPEYGRFADALDVAPDSETARFRFFEAVSVLLRRLGAQRHLVVVLDDLHWADQSSLRLLEFALGALEGAPVLLVGTYRDSEARTPPLAGTLAMLARTPELERIALGGLTANEVGDYVVAVLGEDSGVELAGSLHHRTAGNPFFLAELVRLLRMEGSVPGGQQLPEGVRDVIRTRLARLPEDSLPVLTAGAVAGREFDIALVAHVCGIDEDRALDLVEAAWMTGIVDEAHGDGVGHFQFSHELVRETLCEDLSALRRIRLHRRIGEAIEELHGERNPGFLTECAYHFGEAAAAGAGGPLKAVLYGQRAADRLNAQLAYEDAIPLYERAIELSDTYDVGSWQTRTDLRIGLGWALRATGRLGDARAALRGAMDRAQAEGDPVRIARAVLGIGGGSFWGWWDEFGVTDLDLVRYLERALAALDPEDSVLRCELLARLAIEGYFVMPREHRRALSVDALAMARRLDDPVAITAALASELLVGWRPENLDERLVLDDELVAVAGEHGIAYAELIGRHFRMVDHLEAGDRASADADLAAIERLSQRVGHHAFHIQLAWYRAMLAFVDGRLDEAEGLIDDAFNRNVATNESAAWTAYGAQMFQLRREQGRHGELESLIRSAVDRQPHIGSAWTLSLAIIAADHGRLDDARALLDEALDGGIFDDENDLLIPVHAVRIAEAAAATGHEKAAAMVEPVLATHKGPIALLATGHLCFGAVDRSLGDVARVQGRLDDAIACYERAIDAEQIVRIRIYANRSRLALASALAERDGRGDRERARDIARAVVVVAEELGTPMVAASARALLA